MFTFLITYPHIIFSVCLFTLGVLTLISLHHSKIGKKVTLKKFLFTTVILYILYGVFLTVLQYIVWKGNPTTTQFLTLGLSKEVPLGHLHFLQSLLAKPHGYFTFYVYMKFFFKIEILFIITFIISSLAVLWHKFKPTHVAKRDVLVIAMALLLAGWPSVLYVVPIVLSILIIGTIFTQLFKPNITISISTVFLITSITLIVFGTYVTQLFGLSRVFAL